MSITLLFEGFYGYMPDLHRFTEILPAVGGSGISVGTSTVYKTLEDNCHATMDLVWTYRRTRTHMDSIMEKELKSAFESGRLPFDAQVLQWIFFACALLICSKFITGESEEMKGTLSKAVEVPKGPGGLSLGACYLWAELGASSAEEARVRVRVCCRSRHYQHLIAADRIRISRQHKVQCQA